MIDVRAILNGTKSKGTVDSYMYSWKSYLAYAGSEEDALDSVTLVRWRQDMVNNQGLSANTINTRIRSVRSIVTSLAEQKIVEREIKWDFAEVKTLPPTALRDRARPHARVRITAKQMRKLVDDTRPDLYDPLLCSHRALLLVLGTTGLRISEALRIKVEDLGNVDGSHVVRNVVGKHNMEPRSVPMSREAYEAIMDWIHIRPVHSDYVFIAANRTKSNMAESILWQDEAMTRQTAWRVVRRYGKSIGMPNIKPHDLRRFVGTQLATKAGIRVAQKVLGHASPDTTARYYILDDTPVGVTDELF